MSIPLFALLVLASAALYFMTPGERRRLLEAVLDRVKDAVNMLRKGPEGTDPFHDLLLARTRWPIVAPMVIVMSVFAWFGTLGGSGSATDRLVAMGANHAPHTTTGEWWRLVSYALVPAGFFQLVATIAALIPLGLILERLVGRVAFAAVFVSAALVAGLVSLWTVSATTVTAGATGAIVGLYGLLVVVFVYGYLREPRLPGMSTPAKKLLAGGTGLFALVVFFSAGDGLANVFAGLTTGLIAGLVIARGVTEGLPDVRRSLVVGVAAFVIVMAAAMPLRGTIDARPELAKIADMETSTSSEYAKAVSLFTKGRLPAKALAQVIQRNILPAVQADRARIDALHGVPHDQAPLVAAARRYFELREASWRQRVEGLTASNMKVLREADQAERSALDALEKLQHVTSS